MTDCMGIDEARHEEFAILQLSERDAGAGIIMLYEEFLNLRALYILINLLDITL
jgi:hypothetical protein